MGKYSRHAPLYDEPSPEFRSERPSWCSWCRSKVRPGIPLCHVADDWVMHSDCAREMFAATALRQTLPPKLLPPSRLVDLLSEFKEAKEKR